MYLTIKETAEHLSLKEQLVETLVLQKRIRAIHDGEQYLINKEQFTTHLEEVETYRAQILEYLNEPFPEDLDIKDED
ncbi:excisionase family DNA-binding protein [Sediminibacillus albus]|uniref:DNA binding domain-containing protein, excisionase family n=1 Tax=Sediminibacillus albus TaxID=407036 RepID=A0A1G9B8Y2_9BACI|nr:excisionase family DNA-binding protein [Sediminibacillus albus]SDK35929.1 DNA binding domain-containing protein, excisionase family [Sediminibacillus albus]